jgi:hypothetical protein
MSDRLIDANQVAFLIGISVETLDNWYRFKRQNPDNEYAQMLPDITYMNPEKDTTRQKRYWTDDDVYKLAEFKSTIPQGRNGIMGSITQRYTPTSKHYNKKGE